MLDIGVKVLKFGILHLGAPWVGSQGSCFEIMLGRPVYILLHAPVKHWRLVALHIRDCLIVGSASAQSGILLEALCIMQCKGYYRFF